MTGKRKIIALLSSVRINSGSGYRCAGIAKYLVVDGYDVTLSGVGRPGKDEIGGAKYWAIPGTGNIALLVVVAFFVNLFLLLRVRPELVIVSKPLPSSFLPARLYAALSGVPVIIDIDDIEYDYWRERKMHAAVLKRFEKYSARAASIITTHSRELQEYLQRELGVDERKVWFLPQGIDTGLFPEQNRRTGPAVEVAPEGKTVIVYAAHFNRAVKDFAFILQAMAKLKQTRPDLLLLVIGDGEERPAYERLAGELGLSTNVRFSGRVPHNEVRQYFDAAQVAINYLAPTPANICRASIKLREYLLCGLWVVCNDISSDPRQFDRWIGLFHTDDLEGFCAKVEEAAGRARQGRNCGGAEQVLTHCSWNTIVRSFERQFETM